MQNFIGPAFVGNSPDDLRDTYNRGVHALARGAWDTAAACFEVGVLRDHPSSTFNLASLLLMGRSDFLDCDRGFALMTSAAALGHAEAAERARLNRRYEAGFLPDESVVRMIMQAGNRYTDGLLIRTLAQGLLCSLRAEDEQAISIYHFHETAQFYRLGGGAFAFLLCCDHGPKRPSHVLRDALRDGKNTAGALLSAMNDDLFSVLSSGCRFPAARLNFIRCSVHARVIASAAPRLASDDVPGLGFYEDPELAGLTGTDL